MKAIVREMEFRGEVGVAIYINEGLSKFITRATDLLEEMKALRYMGYDLDFE
jgi:protein associated with RNAse G/E